MAVKMSTITFRLSDIEKVKIEQIAQEKDIPVSQLVREAIRSYIRGQETAVVAEALFNKFLNEEN